ncbi:S24 family peptidase [Pedobacter paludis]|uniref:Peptidase S24/S26A/S26B/S26C domain-containing protein n=1 Tax=Pedobacter paludis TaxID=2203212 RepID=A0A317F416_9SPHI|nr:S24 family peptidase [Pedobacter paludis]PWS32228.1 hypothetical protein DF947_10695 [Pedobacter paludis]
MLREIELPRNIDLEPLANPEKVSGFVSPSEDYKQRRLHISQKFVDDPVNTHYFEAASDEMNAYGIRAGATLVVDRSKPVVSGSIIVCSLDGEWLARKLIIKETGAFLTTGDERAAIDVTDRNIVVFGRITCVLFNL